MNAIAKWFGTLISSSDEASFGRFASLLTLVCCLSWDTAYIVFVMRHFKEFHFQTGDLLHLRRSFDGPGGLCELVLWGQ